MLSIKRLDKIPYKRKTFYITSYISLIGYSAKCRALQFIYLHRTIFYHLKTNHWAVLWNSRPVFKSYFLSISSYHLRGIIYFEGLYLQTLCHQLSNFGPQSLLHLHSGNAMLIAQWLRKLYALQSKRKLLRHVYLSYISLTLISVACEIFFISYRLHFSIVWYIIC